MGGEADGEASAAPGRGFGADRAAQEVGDEVVDDVEPEAAAAAAARGGEEGLVDPAQQLGRDADAVAAAAELDLEVGGAVDPQDDRSDMSRRKCVHERVVQQVGDDLGDRAGVGGDDEVGPHVDLDPVRAAAVQRRQAGQKLVDVGAEGDRAPRFAALVDRELLEAGDEAGGPLKGCRGRGGGCARPRARPRPPTRSRWRSAPAAKASLSSAGSPARARLR